MRKLLTLWIVLAGRSMRRLGLAFAFCALLFGAASAQLGGGLMFPGPGTSHSSGAAPTWLKTDNPPVQTISSGSTATFLGANIGTASSNRIVVVCAATRIGGPLTGVTIATNPTTLAKASNVGAVNAEIWYLSVPSGATADIVLTGTAALQYIGITVGILTGVTATPNSTALLAYGYNPDPNTTSSALTILSTGFGIVCGGSETPNATPTFNVGTLDYERATGALWSVLSGNISASGSQTPSISGYNSAGLAIAAASWGP
jgi:hypothetical protein